MPAKDDRPALAIFVNGLADLETLYPVALGLSKRGEVRPYLYVTRKMARLEPRLLPMLVDSGLQYAVASGIRLKVFYHDLLRRFDAALVLTDPLHDRAAGARRAKTLMRIGTPTIFIQHGVLQKNLNWGRQESRIEYYSKLLLLFESIGRYEAFLGDKTLASARVVGFPKQQYFPLLNPSAEFGAWRQNYRRIVLMCHSFRWASRYGASEIAHFYEMVAEACKRWPDFGFIVRPHRGLPDPGHEERDRVLAVSHPNVIFSYRSAGLLGGVSMQDVLAVADNVVATPSTVVLDAVYAGKRTAVYRNDSDIFHMLPNILEKDDLYAFLDDVSEYSSTERKIKERYGDIGKNITNCCVCIENYINTIK